MGITLLCLGGLVFLVSDLWLVYLGFRESWGCGLACLLLPGVSLLFVVVLLHWDSAARPFVLGVLGLALALGGLHVAARDARSVATGVTVQSQVH